MNVWYCPQGKAFMRTLCRTLAEEDEHAVVSLPERHIQSFVAEFLSYGKKTLGTLQTVTLEAGQPLAESLLPSFLSGAGEEPVPLEEFPELMVRGGSTLVLLFPSELSAGAEEYASFLELMAAHAKACKDQGKTPRWSMLAVMPAHLPLPREEIGLKTFVWWGKLRPSDLEYAVEHALENMGLSETSYYWYYALCKGLAGVDPELVEAIVNDPPLSAQEIANIVRGHELLREDVGRLAQKFWLERSWILNRGVLPRGDAAELWQLGALDIDCYGKPALHPAAMVAAGLENSLGDQLVRGQIQVYLPLTQEVHGFLCQMMRKRFGQDWGKKGTSYTSVEHEIGGLPSYMKTYYSKEIPKEFIKLAELWRDLRNKIAHNTIIPYELALLAVSLYVELRASCTPL